MIRSIFLVSVAMAMDCASPIPGDGRLVLVQTDSEIASQVVKLPGRAISSSPFGVFVQRGIRYWDEVGVRLRTSEQLGAGDIVDASTPVLRVVAAPVDAEGDDTLAWYSESDGEIHVPLPLREGSDANGYSSIIAHEVGHALGLHHETTVLDGNCAIMNPAGCERSDLGPGDIEQFNKIWN